MICYIIKHSGGKRPGRLRTAISIDLYIEFVTFMAVVKWSECWCYELISYVVGL